MRSPTASWSAVSVGSATAAFRLSAAVASEFDNRSNVVPPVDVAVVEGDGRRPVSAVPASNPSVFNLPQRPRRMDWATTPADLPEAEERFGARIRTGIRRKSGTHSNIDACAFPSVKGVGEGDGLSTASRQPVPVELPRAFLRLLPSHGELPGASSLGSAPSLFFQFDAPAAEGIGQGSARREAPQADPASFSSLVTILRIAPIAAGGEGEAGAGPVPKLITGPASASSNLGRAAS